MSSHQHPQSTQQKNREQHYVVLCVLMLFVVLLLLLHVGVGIWSFLPTLIGAMGVFLRWRLTPLLTLLLLAGVLFAHETFPQTGLYQSIAVAPERFSLSAWFLCGVVLAYVVAQCRLNALSVGCFPGERRRDESDESRLNQAGSGRLISSQELGGLLVSLPVWALLAQVCWNVLPSGGADESLSSQTGRAVLLMWITILSILASASTLGYLGLRRLGAAEALLLLQDLFWQETRPEQRRLFHWLTWAKLQRRRRKEQP
jgi:hypothetical protein